MIKPLNGNWVDLLIILILIYYAIQAFKYSFWALIIEFISFFGSLILSLRVYKIAADLLKANFNLPASFNNALGFIVTSILLEILLSYVLSYLILKLPKKIRKYKYNKYLSLIPSMGEGLILITFLLTAIVALPIKPEIKKDILESKIGSVILKYSAGAEKSINNVFGGAINDALTYFTVEPSSKNSIELKSGIDHLSYDHEAETQMFAMVNTERGKKGLPALTWVPKIVPVAEAYAMDMWKRHYFSHYSPEGKNVGDRLDAANIYYQIAGENLALAPTVQTAMTGLMNSEGHRENILSPKFHKVGIGVVDNGVYGKIFVQVFTD